MSSALNATKRPAVRVFVATTVLLSFISFWRAAAIVLSDLGSSAYYVGGDAEKVIGKSAPWFILAVMLFANCVRALYVESTSMFVRGGVYRVVRRAMGSTLAKFSVSALLFDYVLTGPLSSVVAGQYLAGFIQDTAVYLHRPFHNFHGRRLCRRLRHLGHDLFLAQKHPGHARVLDQSGADHDDHHRDGGDSDPVVYVTLFHTPFRIPPNPLKSASP